MCVYILLGLRKQQSKGIILELQKAAASGPQSWIHHAILEGRPGTTKVLFMNNLVNRLTAGNMFYLQLSLFFNLTYMLHAPLGMHDIFCN